MTLKRSTSEQSEMLQGTLDMLVLQCLLFGPAHGYTVARVIQQRSDELLKVGQDSLYLALQRLEDPTSTISSLQVAVRKMHAASPCVNSAIPRGSANPSTS